MSDKSNVLQNVEELKANIAKAAQTVATNTFSPDDRSIFVAENLDERIKLVVPGERGAVLYNRLPKSMGAGEAAGWKKLTSGLNSNIGTVVPGTNSSIAFADGGTPNETTQTYTYASQPYKYYGVKLDVGIGAIIASQSRNSGYADMKVEQEENVKLTEVILGVEELIISGNSAVNSNEFDGLGKQITTNSGTAALLTVSGIGNFEKTLYDLGSSGATLLLLGSFQMLALANQLEGSGSILRITQAMGTGQVQAGSGAVTGIISPVTGMVIDVRPSRYVGGNAYLLTETDMSGTPWIEFEEQMAISKLEVPSTSFSKTSFIAGGGALKVIGEPFQYEIAGLAMS